VKMVHNGIEYGDMQIIAEAYALLGSMGMDNAEMASVFDDWRSGPLSSYLIDITADILATTDQDGVHVLDLILDAAGQKGTGRWTVVASLELGQPSTLMAEAVMARQVSADLERRQRLASVLGGPDGRLSRDALTVADIETAVYGAKIVSYAQGFMLLAHASDAFDWELRLGDVAAIWRAGCIIRAAFLDAVTAAYRDDPDLDHLLVAPYFAAAVGNSQPAMRRVVSAAVGAGVPIPAMASALTFLDGIRSRRLPANLIQAQRDYFGAHTYERVDRHRGERFHTDWTASGGTATSGGYDA
jgi:6-phosphogluconate dehydrogenase